MSLTIFALRWWVWWSVLGIAPSRHQGDYEYGAQTHRKQKSIIATTNTTLIFNRSCYNDDYTQFGSVWSLEGCLSKMCASPFNLSLKWFLSPPTLWISNMRLRSSFKCLPRVHWLFATTHNSWLLNILELLTLQSYLDLQDSTIARF